MLQAIKLKSTALTKERFLPRRKLGIECYSAVPAKPKKEVGKNHDWKHRDMDGVQGLEFNYPANHWEKQVFTWLSISSSRREKMSHWFGLESVSLSTELPMNLVSFLWVHHSFSSLDEIFRDDRNSDLKHKVRGKLGRLTERTQEKAEHKIHIIGGVWHVVELQWGNWTVPQVLSELPSGPRPTRRRASTCTRVWQEAVLRSSPPGLLPVSSSKVSLCS